MQLRWQTPRGEVVLSPVVPDASQPTAVRDPQLARELSERGFRLACQNLDTAALMLFRRALTHDDRNALLYTRMAHSCFWTGALASAREAARAALAIDPNMSRAMNLLGLAHRELDEVIESEAVARAVVARWPLYTAGHINLAMLQLRQRNLTEGLQNYEWRYPPPDGRPMLMPAKWPADLSGKHVLLHPEQGLGDTINFVHLAELAAGRGARVTAKVPRVLLPLLSQAKLNVEFVTVARPRDFDYHAPLLSLLHRLGLEDSPIPPVPSMIKASPAQVARWHGRLAAHEGLRVGVVHDGDPRMARNAIRKFPARLAAEWASVPGVQVFDIERRAPDRPAPRAWQEAGIIDLGTGLDHACAPFEDTVGILANLDLVITCDTSMVHLAAAMGRPVWLLLDRVGDWRWFDNDERSEWYPSLRIFRQHIARDWSQVQERVLAALARITP
ncbi:MAG: hypothetical protein AAF458_19675 [Pseudomonadota bacterium]